MRSLTVPVSFSSLLFPTVPCCLSLSSLLSFLSVVCGFEGAGAGCWDSCCCANAGATTSISPTRIESTIRLCIPFWLTIDNSNYLPEDLHGSSKRDDPVSIMLGPNLDSLDEKGFYPHATYKQGLRPQPLMVSATGEHCRAARKHCSPEGSNLRSPFFLVDFEIQNDVLATVEA